jgi:hypothetical protein
VLFIKQNGSMLIFVKDKLSKRWIVIIQIIIVLANIQIIVFMYIMHIVIYLNIAYYSSAFGRTDKTSAYK